jgi:hypothetical protein
MKKWKVMGFTEGLKDHEMEFVDHFESDSDETASLHAITVLGFGYTSEEILKTKSAVDVLGDLGYYVMETRESELKGSLIKVHRRHTVLVCENKAFKV